MRLPAFQFLQLKKSRRNRGTVMGQDCQPHQKTSDAPRCLAHDMTKELGR